MKIFLKCLLLTTFASGLNSENANQSTFPDDFLFGVATAAYQTEGGWNASGKKENIWDHFTHTQSHIIKDNSNGDVACNSYHKIHEDLALLKNLGVNFYRFSLSWSRILLSPFREKVNEDGIRYYNDLINLLLENDIQPLVTLYHWDLLQSLQNLGGFANSIIIEAFVMYAKVAFEKFGDRVKLWTTFNQPQTFCVLGYGGSLLAPSINLSGIAEYLCAHNVLKAHAGVYHLYNDTFKSKQGGHIRRSQPVIQSQHCWTCTSCLLEDFKEQVSVFQLSATAAAADRVQPKLKRGNFEDKKGRLSITLNTDWFEPASSAQEDIEAATRAVQFSLGWYAHPIYTKLGDYPKVMIQDIGKRSRAEKFTNSRLPKFTKQELGTFLAVNRKSNSFDPPSFVADMNINKTQDPSWPATVLPTSTVVPWGFSKALKWIKEQYEDPEIYITENGYPDFGELEDSGRINYFYLYLSALLESIHKDGVRVKAYTAWSLLDNFEWVSGYTVKYGLHYVDFSSPNRTRSPKSSAEYFKRVIVTRKP